uniref:Uncharacterized protein n=1 Tax=Corvus moneduloides TaxID=1196302 RepID=A0A8C3H1B2_CORMO
MKQGQVSGLQELVNLTCALEETDQREWLPLPEVAARPIPQILEITLDASYKSTWEYKTCNGKIALTLAAKTSCVKNVQMILEKGIYPSTINYKGETPLLLGNCLLCLGLSNMTNSTSSLFNTQPSTPIKHCSAMHEAAKQRCTDIVDLLTNDGNVNIKGGDVKTLADDCASVLFKTAGGRSLGCIALLLEYGGSGNVPNEAGLLPIHKVACEYELGLYIFSKKKSHSAVDGQNQFLELVIENGLDVNTLLTEHVTSDTYNLKERWMEGKLHFTVLFLTVRSFAPKYSMELLLLSHGYNVEMCLDFMCQGIFRNSSVRHLAGKVVSVFVDYMDYVPLKIPQTGVCSQVQLLYVHISRLGKI